LRFSKTFQKDVDPIISVVIPVFDQEQVIFSHLTAIIKNMTLPFEFLIINDASSDQTDSQVRKFIDSIDSGFGSCHSVKYFKTIWPWFETRCDDFAIRFASGKYVIEIQADMLLRELGFDEALFKLMESDNSIAALSGRGSHRIEDLLPSLKENKSKSDRIFQYKLLYKIVFKLRKEIRLRVKYNLRNTSFTEQLIKPSDIPTSDFLNEEIFPSEEIFQKRGKAGFLGTLVNLLPYKSYEDINRSISQNSGKVWFGETIMRGPLIINRDFYLEIGGFNTEAFYLGDDDHDFCLRAREFDKKVGFTPINFASPLELGTTRRKKSIKTKIWIRFQRRIRMKSYRSSDLVKFSKKVS